MPGAQFHYISAEIEL